MLKSKDKKKTYYNDMKKYEAFKISLIYFVIGINWILFSDSIANKLAINKNVLTIVSTYKGGVYVFATTVILYCLIVNLLNKKAIIEKKLIKSYEDLSFAHRELCMQNDKLDLMSKKLIESERRLKKSQAIGNIGNWEIDLLSNTVWASEQALLLYGIASEDGIIPLQTIQNMVVKEDRNRLDNALNRLLQKNQKYDIEFRIINTNFKEERYMHSIAALEYGDDGKPIRVLGVIQDITKQKFIEDILRMSEENLRITLQSIGDGVIATDINESVQLLNNSAQSMTGWTQEQAVGLSFSEVFNISHEEPNMIIKDPVKEVLKTNKICELANHAILTSKDGSRRNIADSAAPIKDIYGNTKGVVMVFRDVTERKEMNLRLEKYKILVEKSNDPMFFIDEKGRILEANDAAVRIYGYTYKEFSFMNIFDLRYLENKSIIYNQMEVANEKGLIFETEHCLKNGTKISVEVSSIGTLLGGKSVLLSIVRDITERKKAQEEILYLSYHDQLTGLYNRRFYEEELMRLDTERNLPIALVIADVNGLKLTNDAFGHNAGDILLKKIADILKRECRADEIVARIGGDEFVFLFPKTDAKGAEKIIQRIHANITKEKMDNIILSISMGFSVKQNVFDDINGVFKKAEDNMYKNKLSEGKSIRSKTIDLIMNSLYEKSRREMLHSKRVSEICEAISLKMNFEKDHVNRIRIAGLMHDIGKIGINDNILNKGEKLNKDEWTEIKRHPEIGYRILSSVNEFSQIADYVLEHQERWDGKGYPKGLKGDEISIEARIIAVADSYDAMTSERSYRSALSQEVAIEELRKNAGTQFDFELVSVFIEKVLSKLV